MVSKREGLFRVTGDNEGLACPFKPIICEVGDCHQCQIYFDWEKLGELIQVCAWCSKIISRKPNLGRPVVSHGICPECMPKYFGIRHPGTHCAERAARMKDPVRCVAIIKLVVILALIIGVLVLFALVLLGKLG